MTFIHCKKSMLLPILTLFSTVWTGASVCHGLSSCVESGECVVLYLIHSLKNGILVESSQ